MELVPISFTLTSLMKTFLILATNMFLGYAWYSPMAFQTQWRKAMQWKDEDQHDNAAIFMSCVGTLLSSFLLNILLIAFDIRKYQYLSAILAATILCGFYAVNGWNHMFFAKPADYKRHRTLYLLDIGHVFVLYFIISIILVSF